MNRTLFQSTVEYAVKHGIKTTLLFLLILTLSLPLQAQQCHKKQTTAEPNYELAARFSSKALGRMVFSTRVSPNWFKNSNKFWYWYQTPQGTFYYIVDPTTGSKKQIFDNAKLAAELTEIVRDPFDAQNIPLRNLKLVDDKKFSFEITSTEEVKVKDEKTGKDKTERKVFGFEYDINSKKLTEIKDYKKYKPYPYWGNVSPDKKTVIFSRNFNLYYMDMENFEKARINDEDSTIVEHQLTTDGTREFAFGEGNPDIYAKDKELNKRYSAYAAWSPDSKKFAIIRTDERNVKDLWVINSLSSPRPTLESYKYQMPGETGAPKEHLYIYDMASKKAKEYYISSFKDQSVSIHYKPSKKKDRNDEINPAIWLGTTDKLYFSRTSRDQKRIEFCEVALDRDSSKVVLSEKMNTYIESRPIKVINDGKEFIQWSERTGWAQLYLYNSDGKLKNAITKGSYHVERVEAIDEQKRVVYFTANGLEAEENPYYTHLYRINFDGSGLRLLNKGNFNNQTDISDDGAFFVNNYSRVDASPKSDLYDNSGRNISKLESTDISALVAAGYKYPEPFTLKAGDGTTDLYGVMYKPFDFDSTKRYPIIEYVYPGPQTEAVNFSWSKSMNRVDRLAQLGFIVITVGNRGGSPMRSKWYHNYGYGNLRDYGLEDQKIAVEKLAAKYPFIDISKVGIHGHSGGGFMSTAAILQYPDFYTAAVSCAGNHENNIYNRWWSEQHHGVKEIVSEKGDTTFKYDIEKNSQLARRLKGHLLLVTGDIDNNVHPANTLRMVNALIRYNKRFDLLILPGQRHGFGDMDDYFFWKMADYFSEHLIGKSKKEIDISELNNE